MTSSDADGRQLAVEDLLAHPLLWRGQDGGPGGATGNAAIATGFAPLDAYLPGGGWPLTGISEIFIERYGLGELEILMPALAALSHRATAARQWIVWIAPPFVPYAPALEQHGVDLSRMLLVHPAGKQDSGHFLPDASEALWAIEQAIRSQSSAAVLAWVRQADVPALRRLQLGAEAHRCWTILFRPPDAIAQGSPAALRFSLSPPHVSGDRPVMDRAGIRIDVHKCRGRRPRSFVL